ncbi:MAG: hypothetical protein LW860_11330 [Xanthomonadaceae bacterium]|nr:hypothetical protein [Xanthomonadaceae bacterium]
MSKPLTLLAILLVVLAGALSAAPAAAPRAISLQDAVDRVQRETGGKILSAETVRQGRASVYRIKVLTREGRVQVVTVPAAGSGRANDRTPPPPPPDDDDGDERRD